ncbi:GntR family transcriptional regulator [Paeniglutamicibacter cryotolerans]|uniref:DNA-binding GntR family transcriptional regulator n=1 Tax=Paeniglutamicibacter cryotolerans TaxID=670079 RepID=A0A839QKZ1_9MICC|nr:GntR family transcriptional regulator [Paeniglutamicibacter cryotolerans]MBB2996283.1 DNA-binding GntR family transcriptional regulator [Paeniglutamicibacter cryotolerans]
MRASEKAYTELRRDIVEWRLAPGAVLGEVDQAERLGVSRTPLREALARLVSDGLAVQQRGRGVVVSDVSLEHIDHLFQLRRALEIEAARTAAATGDTGEFTDLAERFTRAAALSGAGNSNDYYQLAADLDGAIDHATGNPYLEQSLRSLRVHLARVRRLAQDDPERLRTSAGEHAQIASAIAARNPELAAAATLLHLHHSLEHIKNHAGTREETT